MSALPRLTLSAGWLPAYLVLVALVPLVHVGRYALDVLLVAHLQVLYVVSWDVASGPTRRASFGHSLFVGGTAYATVLLHVRAGWAPHWAALTALGGAAATGAAFGWATRRLRGASFALVTMALQLLAYQALFAFPGMLGGEEGIGGVAPLVTTPLGSYYLVLAAAAAAVLARGALHGSRVGLLLTAIGDDEELARASGVPAARLQVATFALGALLGGLGGVLYAHTQRQVNPDLLGSALSVQLVLVGLLGGRGNGPVLAALSLEALRQLQTGVAGAGVLCAAALVGALLLHPSGIVERTSMRAPASS